MSFLGRKNDKDDKKQVSQASPQAPPMIDPNTGLPPPYEPPDPSAPKAEEKVGFVKGIQNYILDSYNGLYKIVLEPSMPTRGTIGLLIVGLIIGMISAYAIFPTEFTGAGPRRMSDGAVEQWVKMVAVGKSSGINYRDADAIAVLQQLPNPQQAINRVINNPETKEHEINAVRELQSIEGFNELTGSVAPQDPGIVGSLVQIIVPILLVVIITPILVVVWRLLIYPNIVAGIFDAFKRATNKEYAEESARSKKELKTLQDQKRIKEEMAKNVVADVEFGEPVIQTISIYTKGRNYDDSFAIELGPEQNNQFLGECGASIATKAGDDVQSIEFWGFDMATQMTLTKIFVAPAAINDPTLQAKVSNRVKNPAADIIAAQTGATLTLDTDAIRIQGEIVSIAYNEAGGSPNSGIENMQMKVSAWQKQSSPVGAGVGAPPPIPPAQPLPDYSDMQFDPPPQMPTGNPAPLPPAGGRPLDDYANMQFDPPPQMPTGNPAPLPPAGGRPLDDYANMQFDPPPQMPTGNPAPLPPAGGRALDEYDDIQFDPPPQMPGQTPLQPPPLQMPSTSLNPLQPPPLRMPPTEDEDDDPFGGTGDFTPLS